MEVGCSTAGASTLKRIRWVGVSTASPIVPSAALHHPPSTPPHLIFLKLAFKPTSMLTRSLPLPLHLPLPNLKFGRHRKRRRNRKICSTRDSVFLSSAPSTVCGVWCLFSCLSVKLCLQQRSRALRTSAYLANSSSSAVFVPLPPPHFRHLTTSPPRNCSTAPGLIAGGVIFDIYVNFFMERKITGLTSECKLLTRRTSGLAFHSKK